MDADANGCGGRCKEPCMLVDCMEGWNLVDTDQRGCGGRCEKPPPVCCKALTASCLACAAKTTEALYCASNPKTEGCPQETTQAPTVATTLAPEATKVCGCARDSPCKRNGGATCFAAVSLTNRCPVDTTRCRCECWGASPCIGQDGSCHAMVSLYGQLVCPTTTLRCPSDPPLAAVTLAPVATRTACSCGGAVPCQHEQGDTCFAAGSSGECPPQTRKCSCPCTGTSPCHMLGPNPDGAVVQCVKATNYLGQMVCPRNSLRCKLA